MRLSGTPKAAKLAAGYLETLIIDVVELVEEPLDDVQTQHTAILPLLSIDWSDFPAGCAPGTDVCQADLQPPPTPDQSRSTSATRV